MPKLGLIKHICSVNLQNLQEQLPNLKPDQDVNSNQEQPASSLGQDLNVSMDVLAPSKSIKTAQNQKWAYQSQISISKS